MTGPRNRGTQRLRLHRLLAGCALLLLLPLSEPGAEEQSSESKDLLEKALNRVDSLYLHPEVIDPVSMTRDGIQAMEHAAADLLVLEQSDSRLLVRSGVRERTVSIDGVDSLDSAERTIREVADFIARERVDELSAEDLHVQALKGMLRTIDRHSRLIVGGSLDEFNTRFKGTLVGIGARIGRRQGKLRVIEPFKEAPAGKAGLLPGDAITHIDGHPTEALDVGDAVDRIRGPEGVPVVLTVERAGEEGRRVFVIVRAKVVVPSVKSARLDGDIGYITIDHFSQKTSGEVADALDGLASDGALHALIIDLRGNTGGSMRHATRIVNYFVAEGTLVRTEGSDGLPVAKLTARIEADARHLRFDGPVAVLIDEKTASGSEILAGGLKYTERSLTIGSQTFGKGTVQKVYPLRREGDKVSMKLTVARYLLPGDAFINSVGVTPDIVTGMIWLDPLESSMPDRLREPARYTGRDEGRGGLDSRRNPGGGRQPTTTGTNRAPLYRLAYPRVTEAWANPEDDSEPGESGSSKPTEEADEEPIVLSTQAWPNLPGDAGEPVFNDLELRLAHDILVHAPSKARREELLALAEPVVDSWQDIQSERMAAAFELRDIPWDADSPPGWMDRAPGREDGLQKRLVGKRPEVEASVEFPESLQAGSEGEVRVLIRNTTERKLTHLRARMESSTSSLDGLDFLIGDLAPGQEASWRVPLRVPATSRSRLDTWRLYLLDDSGPLGTPFQGVSRTRGLPRPTLQTRITSSSKVQKDGSVTITAKVRVRNTGPGDAAEVRLDFGTPDEEGVERLERWAKIEELPSGEEGEVELRLRLRAPSRITQTNVRLRARDLQTLSATIVALELPTDGSLDTGWLNPPSVTLLSPASHPGAEPARSSGVFKILGSVTSDDGLESVQLTLHGDKILALPPPGADEPPRTRVELDTTTALRRGPNKVRVKATTHKGVSVTRTVWVLGAEQNTD